MIYGLCVYSALVKLLNKSVEGTADDDEEGVTPDTAIRAGLELLKVSTWKDTWILGHCSFQFCCCHILDYV